MVAFHIDHLQEVVEGVKRGRSGNVVYKEEGVRAEIGCSPQATIFLLAGGIGEREVVRVAVNDSCYRVRVL